MKILVLSDSHRNVDAMARAVEKEKPDRIIHLGDHFADGEELHELYPRIPMEQVPGNCDLARFEAPERLLFIENLRVLIAHGHTMQVKSGLLNARYRAMEKGADLLLFGHTHVPLIELQGGITMLNPGAIGDSRRPTYGILRFAGGKCVPSVERLEEEER